MKVIAAVTLSVALILLSFPPINFSPAAFFSWVPMLVLLKYIRFRHLIVYAYIHGILLNVFAQIWLVSALQTSAGFMFFEAVLALILVALVQGVHLPLVFYFVRESRRLHCPVLVSFPVFAIVVEYFLPRIFPWTAALQVNEMESLLQIAALGGTAAVSLWVYVINGLLAESIHRYNLRGGHYYFIALALLVFSANLGYGQWMIDKQLKIEKEAQSGVLILGHMSSEDLNPVDLLRNETLRVLHNNPNSDLIIWPETLIDYPTAKTELRALTHNYLMRDRIQGPLKGAINRPLLFGLNLQENGSYYNTAMLVQFPGVILGRYDKKELVPLGETFDNTVNFSWLRERFSNSFHYSPGKSFSTMQVNERNLAVSICYEDILEHSFRRNIMQSKPQLLVNLTSDSWFKGTAGVDYHFALSRLRSIEHRKYLVRSTRDGVSAVVNSVGRVVQLERTNTTKAIIAPIRWIEDEALYTNIGSSWIYVLMMLFTAFVILHSLTHIWRAKHNRNSPNSSLRPSKT